MLQSAFAGQVINSFTASPVAVTKTIAIEETPPKKNMPLQCRAVVVHVCRSPKTVSHPYLEVGGERRVVHQ